MNWGEALIALDIGQRVRFRGMPSIVTGVAVRRRPSRDLGSGKWGCAGDRYFGVDLIDERGRAMTARLEELLTEEEYLISIKEGEQHGNDT